MRVFYAMVDLCVGLGLATKKIYITYFINKYYSFSIKIFTPFYLFLLIDFLLRMKGILSKLLITKGQNVLSKRLNSTHDSERS
jgi:hypothetical protein